MSISYDSLMAYINGLHADGTLSDADYNQIILYILANGNLANSPRDLIQVRRGNAANLPTLAQGEFGLCLDTEKLYIGGQNANNIPITMDSQLNYVSVKAYGAKGDGTTDDTAAINAAYNTIKNVGGTLYFPHGTYLYTGTLALLPCVVICGIGSTPAGKGSILKINAGENAAITNLIGTSQIRDIMILDNGGTGIGVHATRQIIMKNVEVSSFKETNLLLEHDASLQGAYESLIENCIFTYSDTHGAVNGNGANSTTWINCQFKWNGFADGNINGTSNHKDGFYNGSEYNPHNVTTFTPQSVRFIGGDASYNSRYGFNIYGILNGNVVTGYAEGNSGSHQVNIDVNVQYSYVYIGNTENGLSGVRLNNTLADYNRTNTIFYGGQYIGGGGSTKQSYLLNNIPTITLAESADKSKLVWFSETLSSGDFTGAYNINNWNSDLHFYNTGTEQLKIGANIVMPNLPTVDPHIVGALWNSSGTLKVSAG